MAPFPPVTDLERPGRAGPVLAPVHTAERLSVRAQLFAAALASAAAAGYLTWHFGPCLTLAVIATIVLVRPRGDFGGGMRR